MNQADPVSGVYERLGEEGIARLTAAFYRRVPDDDILGVMYPKHDLEASEQRLRDFLVFRFGGPQRYIEQRGHPRLRMRHAPFVIDERARDRWLTLMDHAIAETDIPQDVVAIMRPFFEHVADFMINRRAAAGMDNG